jgi:hypothetical protein
MAWLAKGRLVGERLTAGSGLVPVPERLTVCGLLAALSEMLREPLLVPAAVGVKVTLIAHSAPAATEPPQVFVCAKSLAFAPVTARLVMLNAAFPPLVRVTDWILLDFSSGSLPKLRLAEDKLKAGALTVLGTASVAPPPQEAEKMTSAIKTASTVAAITRCGCRALDCMKVVLVTSTLRD